MSSYLTKLLAFLLFVAFIIGRYYGILFHNESGTDYMSYAITIVIFYGIYKAYWMISGKSKVSFSPLSLGLYTLLHIATLSFVFFGLTGGANGGFVLFFKIFGYLILPILITLISYGFAKKMLKSIGLSPMKEEDGRFHFLLTLGFAFVLFLTSLTILGSFGLYNLWSIGGILVVFIFLSSKEILETLASLWTHRIELPNHRANGSFLEQISLPLISSEFLFLVLTFLIGVNFVNIIRPMPIGWDDLGAYMNYPQIMANNGTILHGVGMTAWQVLTGIGFMFHSAPQAFFLNQIGGILSIIVLAVVFSSLLKDEKKPLINLPLLGATMFYAMPMVIFQQAKDMKLDPGLFFVSVISVYGIIYLLLEYKKSLEVDTDAEKAQEKSLLHFFDHRHNLLLILILGTIAGLAFAIKFTSLMLILGLIGVIFYAKLGLAGFLGYFAAFVAIFTKWNLWSQLNVSYPKDDTSLLQTVTIVSFLLSVGFFVYAWKKYRSVAFKKSFLLILIFSLGIILPVAPWIVKNLSETGLQNITINNLLNGKWDVLAIDYTKIYTKDELAKIEAGSNTEAISSSGQAQNEDLGRYFGYEDGVNNYLKLPLNLTTQSNQPGEYTEITYFYLALIPIIFLFLAYGNPWWLVGLLLSIAFEFAYFFYSGTSSVISSFFARQLLPGGYSYIALFSFLPIIYYTFALRREKKSELFNLNLAFATIYAFLFVIAAYGIVWYGITMYFSFLLAILIGGWYLTSVSDTTDTKENIIKFFGSLVLLLSVSVYFFASSIPHGWSNLRTAGFSEFKAGTVNQEEGIFGSHPDYFSILSTLNLADEKPVFDTIMSQIQNPTLKKLIESNIGSDQTLKKLDQILTEVQQANLEKLGVDSVTALSIQSDARSILTSLYEAVLYPSKASLNSAGIYRIGTFLTYFIANNRQRYYDDSLVTNFAKYFYDADPNTTIARMEKMGLKYLLVDLNAATIDKDPRHDLTKRYESLLRTFRSDKLELVQTDSLCLEMALEEKDDKTYMSYAGVNYESYKKEDDGSETTINRGQKQFECYNHILGLIKDNKIDSAHYSYLLTLANYLKQNPPADQQAMLQLFQNYVGHGWLALFRIK